MMPRLDGVHALSWLGSAQPHLDQVQVTACGAMLLGCYGGHKGAGAFKNEDAAVLLAAEDGSWELAAVVDAHFSSQSAALIVGALEEEAPALARALGQKPDAALRGVEARVLGMLRSETFRARCRSAVGEASALFAARKGGFLWWLAVGDCALYLLDPERARMGEFALTQRRFGEWIGARNTFDLPVPCYSTGVRELPPAECRILLVTDGLLEFGERPFEDPTYLYTVFAALARDAESGVRAALEQVHRGRGLDSATVVAWDTRLA